jgi:hypothetical protein
MASFLFRVQWVYEVPNRGVVLSPSVGPQKRPTLKEGDAVELRRPDGTRKVATARGFYFVHKTNDHRDQHNIDLLMSEIFLQRGRAAWYRGLVDRSGMTGVVTKLFQWGCQIGKRARYGY